MDGAVEIDYATWDWLPKAADEMRAYMVRLLEESGIKPHDVSARAKSIASFQRKQQTKKYSDPMREVTDIVAIRIITYSNTDRDRACELIRGRFEVKKNEDRNPGDDGKRLPRRRGYDCWHIVVEGEDPRTESGWLVSGGKLEKYFEDFGGLEIQIRTVAGHAWAEFEHARRYKGAQYQAISDRDQEIIDQLFGAASDARRALDETFVAIDGILARPSEEAEQELLGEARKTRDTLAYGESPLDLSSLDTLLAARFPDDKKASEKGLEFGLELVKACGLKTVESVEAALEAIDSEQVLALMDFSGSVTRVRRLDDELLARFGEEYIAWTRAAGSVSTREKQLEWRFDRLRGKARYRAYLIHSNAWPADMEAGPQTAAGTVREVACVVARSKGIDAAVIEDAISRFDNLPGSARAKEVPVTPEESIWVRTNLNREYSEALMKELLDRVPELNIRIMRGDTVVAGVSEQ